jgi:hypothetical protein
MVIQQTIFDLDGALILHVLERAVGSKIASLSISFNHSIEGHPGYQGQKCIPTFDYQTEQASRDRITMFVKRHDQAGRIEAEQFRFLQGRGAPIPRLYEVVKDKRGCDVLFLEYLPKVYTNREVYENPDLLRRFAGLAARLNTLPVSESYRALPHHGSVSGIPDRQAHVLPEVVRRSADCELGTELQDLAKRNGSPASQLEAKLHRLGSAVAAFGLGFVHGDFWPFHVGSRSGSDELIAVDLGWSLLASRFFDIAPFVGPADEDINLCLSRDEVARHYLDEYCRLSGTTVSLDEFLLEADAVWAAWNSRRIGWLLPKADAGNRKARITLHWLLSIIAGWEEGEQLRPPYSLKARLQAAGEA